MKVIKFLSINRKNNRHISFQVEESLEAKIALYDFFFEFNIDNEPSDDAIALAFSCMLGRKQYDYVYMDLNISPKTSVIIENSNQVKFQCKGIVKPSSSPKAETGNILLNFSGGLDSLAALNLLPKERVKLVSMEFEGRFERESRFFKEFNPFIVRTNFRESRFFKKLEAVSWQFMGIASILYAEKLKAKYVTFGTILEADKNFNCVVGNNVLPFSAIGLQYLSPINGLTEIGTTKLAFVNYPEYINKSLDSLASKGSVKRLRKDLLVSVFKQDIKINSVSHFTFGKDYVFDFLLLYFIKSKGFEFISKYVEEIPESAVNLVKNLKLDFYEKVNPKTFVTFNERKILDYYLRELFAAGIDVYNKNDFYELGEVRKWLANIYKQDNQHILLIQNDKLEKIQKVGSFEIGGGDGDEKNTRLKKKKCRSNSIWTTTKILLFMKNYASYTLNKIKNYLLH